MAVPFAANNYIPKKYLSFAALKGSLSSCFHQIEDNRQLAKVSYTQHDALMSGFACMFFQSSSLLAFQRQLEKRVHNNNLRTLFGIDNIPQESQLRDIIDACDSESFRPFFKELLARLQRGKHLLQYQFIPGYYLCSLDGTQYHSSNTVNCEHCLTKEHRNGSITYSHSVIQAAIMHPDCRQVIPLFPEEIKNSDGTVKQDCEMNAAKRFLPKLRGDHPQLGFIMVGDGLFSKQPFISDLVAQRMHYILVAKPDDHKYLMEWLAAYPTLHTTEKTDDKGRKHIYKWMSNVPLNANPNAPMVNYFQYQLITTNNDGEETVAYQNSWVTDLPIDETKVIDLVRAGRCRWKIENECFNTLKNQGYAVEHNYGHGKQNLCHNFYLLTLLAFTFHQIFEMTDKLYQACRKKCGSKIDLWESIRSAVRYFVFASWEVILDITLDPDRYETTATLKAPP